MNKFTFTIKDFVYMFGLVILMLLLIASVSKNFKKYTNTTELYEKKVSVFDKVVVKEKELTMQNKYLSSDFGREQALRDKYNVSKLHEEVIALLPEKDEKEIPRLKIKTWWDIFIEFTGW